jgi:hypothetical protein
MTSTSNQRTSTSKLTRKLCRSAAVLGLAAIGSLSAALVGSAVTASDAGASPYCPPFSQNCPIQPPITRPPVFDPGVVGPPAEEADPGTNPTTPPSTPPTTPPTSPTNGGQNTNNPPRTNTGGNGNATPVDPTPVPAAETTSVDDAAVGDTESDDGGSSLPYIAIVGGVAALGAAGTGLYLRYGRRA